MRIRRTFTGLLVVALGVLVLTPVAAARKPDLVETQVSNPPGTRVQGARFNITDTVKNKGAAKAAPSITRYYLSLNSSRGPGDKRLTGERSVPGLKPGSSSQGIKKVTIPLNTVLGAYFVVACADDKKNVNESKEGNNCKSSARKINVTPADSTPPDPPVITGFDPVSGSDDNTPQVNGTAEPLSTVKLYESQDCTGAVEASEQATTGGLFGIEASVLDGSMNDFSATATDAANNTSLCSASALYAEDSTTPGPPTITNVTPASPSSSTAVTVFGNAETGTVKLYTTNDCTGPVADSDSESEFNTNGLGATVPLNQTTLLTVNVTDAAGHVSDCSATATYVNDSEPPSPPAITGTDPASPSNDATPMVIGTAEAGSTVIVYNSPNCTPIMPSQILANGSAADFANPGLQINATPNTTNTLTVAAFDAANNQSPCSTPFNYVHDSIPPNPPSSLAFSPASPFNDNNPEITGSAEAGSSTKIYKVESTAVACPAEGQLVATGTAAQLGSGITVNVVDNSQTLFRLTATDAAGNTSLCSGGMTYVEDSPPLETEPNGNAGTATPLVGVTPHVNGRISAVSEVDFYSVTVPQGGSLRAETTGQFGSQASCPGTTLTLLGTDQTTVLTSSNASCSIIDGAGGINTSSPNAAANNMTAGTYFLRVEETGNDGEINAYRLRVAVGNALTGSEVEPNDTTLQANGNGIDFTGDDLRGGNLPVGDLDYYRVNLASASVVRTETFDGSGTDCRGAGSLATRVSLMNSNGSVFKSDSGTPGIGPCSAITAELPAGISYVVVEEANNDGIIGQYRLQFEVLTNAGDEVEPNDRIDTATTLPGSNAVISGDHEVASDTDVYAIAVSNGQSIRAEIVEGNGNLVETCESASLDSTITLTNSAGDVLSFDDDDGRSTCSLLDGTGLIPSDWGAHNLAAGTYYLQIESFSSSVSNASNVFDYRLAVTVR